ncbi:hypothetical protein [Capillimicrobium parvum]|uniref:Uncharacterized protein n=1 Tax=Capillimicrobium parvum TaxID=2884022 RepID=A0A9E7C1X7_9ACTN|nr:hypothetical protein [Capillimicrobium parvum]UGS37154.1 hypothetical protein DSM104329_03569 [Capillimicrobium parvum]
MTYAVEWMPGVAVVWIVLLFLLVPEFAVIAVVVLACAALVALVALAAAALVSPYLLVRIFRRRLAQSTARRGRRWIDSPSASPAPLVRLIGGVPRPAQTAVFAQDEPLESRAILGVGQSLRQQTGRREPVLRSAGVHRGRGPTEDPDR